MPDFKTNDNIPWHYQEEWKFFGLAGKETTEKGSVLVMNPLNVMLKHLDFTPLPAGSK